MGRKIGRPRAGERQLSRALIIAAALRIVDADGVPALSMRRLAGELGVDTMAIYHHLPGKRALMSGLVEAAFAGFRPPPAEGAWQERVLGFGRAYLATINAHRHLALHMVANLSDAGDVALQVSEPLYAALEAAGLAPEQVRAAADLVVDYLHGCALAGASGDGGPAGPAGLEQLLGRASPGQFPALSRALASAGPAAAPPAEAGLAIIMRGIAALARPAA